MSGFLTRFANRGYFALLGLAYLMLEMTFMLRLARFLGEQPAWVRGRRVLDFGSGSGVAGIAAARQGAAERVSRRLQKTDNPCLLIGVQ